MRRLYAIAFAEPHRWGPIASLFQRRPRLRVRTDLLRLLTVDHKKSIGGAELGRGRQGTRVYTADELPDMYHDAVRTCIYWYGAPKDPVCIPSSKGGIGIGSIVGDQEGGLGAVAIKDIPDEADALLEVDLHDQFHQWFLKAGELDATPLHPTLNSAELVFADAASHRVLLYRAMEDDTSSLRLDGKQVMRVAVACLRALVVLHANGIMHLDIKPHNVLYRRKQGAYEFVLGDYGLASPASAVRRVLQADGSPSGTDDYVSPLLIPAGKSSDNNNVFPRFYAVADAVRLRFRGRTLEEAFALQRNAIKTDVHVYKADLHSLALTMVTLLRWSKIQPVELTLAENTEVAAFIGRLMFMRSTDFSSAISALRAARKLVL